MDSNAYILYKALFIDIYISNDAALNSKGARFIATFADRVQFFRAGPCNIYVCNVGTEYPWNVSGVNLHVVN